MEEYTQDDRIIRVETPLGKDVLLLQAFEGEDSVSDSFSFDLEMHSTNHDISLDSLIGQKATIAVRQSDNSDRYVNGIVSEFRYVGTFVLREGRESSILSHYQARIVPWFWTLKLNRDCRIFQNLSVPDIIREIFNEHHLAEFEIRLTANYAVREYCVQYRESDFNFVSRLLEEEGIFYFYEHTSDNHKMVLADIPTQFKPLQHHPKVDFATIFDVEEIETVATGFKVNRQMRSEKIELRDFNFKNPSFNLTANLKAQNPHGQELEIYDYPGEYESRSIGEKLARTRLEAEKSEELLISAESKGRGFVSGYRFELKNHPRKDFNREYIILGVKQKASQSGNYRSGGSKDAFNYDCSFVSIPFPTNYRPARETEIPKIQGTQTAIVVGPKGEEIFVDKHGRVKVQFHWDRLGKRNENSSCWIRVSQPWAGTGFGGITIPRIGQEVIVDFLEGDPDRPIITGRVYNGASMPPYNLPANKEHSGLMSRSSPGGGSANFNGIRMNDSSGSEMMEVQAEKDQQILVKNNNDKTIGNCETVQVGVDRTENVGNNESVTIGNNQQIKVGTDRSEDVGSNETVKIGSNRNTTVGSNDVLSVGMTRTHTVGINEAVSIGAAQEVSIGAVQIVSVGISQINTIGLKQKTTAGNEISFEAPKILLKATQELTLKCGAGVITFDSTGNITIKGPLVKINT